MERGRLDYGDKLMDISKEYIKMCEKAVEIQSIWNIKGRSFGDFFSNAYSITQVFSPNTFSLTHEPIYWLPRQDQLQEMVDLSGKNLRNDCSHWYICEYDQDGAAYPYPITDWVQIDDHYGYKGFDTAEKAYLAFIMQEKYNKTWNGEDWI